MRNRENALIRSHDDSFQTIINLANNLLVDNVNFRKGFYVKTFPNSLDFANKVVFEYRDFLLDKVDEVLHEFSAEWESDSHVPGGIRESFDEITTLLC